MLNHHLQGFFLLILFQFFHFVINFYYFLQKGLFIINHYWACTYMIIFWFIKNKQLWVIIFFYVNKWNLFIFPFYELWSSHFNEWFIILFG